MLAGLEIQFPIICTDAALQNTHFANGYRQTIRIWEKLHNPEEYENRKGRARFLDLGKGT